MTMGQIRQNKQTQRKKFEGSNEIADYGQHIFEFVNVLSYVTLHSGRLMEPLYFVVVKEKGVADKLLRDCYDHVINNGEMFFRGNYLKLVRSRIPSIKQFQVTQREVLLPPDEINDIYIDINNDLQMNINVYNGLISKARF